MGETRAKVALCEREKHGTGGHVDEGELWEVMAGRDSRSREPCLGALAEHLLRERLLLSALELHAELLERGCELPNLRDFFSNPGNFESFCATPALTSLHSGSLTTLDSLDFARFSDDGVRESDERVAVLEFELRKAQETIRALRASLTHATEPKSPAQVLFGEKTTLAEDVIQPLERCALNFLVNEYLLQNGYKLTAITFSEENGEQDVEMWDDVGLNVPKPPTLLAMYRGQGQSDPTSPCLSCSNHSDHDMNSPLSLFSEGTQVPESMYDHDEEKPKRDEGQNMIWEVNNGGKKLAVLEGSNNQESFETADVQIQAMGERLFELRELPWRYCSHVQVDIQEGAVMEDEDSTQLEVLNRAIPPAFLHGLLQTCHLPIDSQLTSGIPDTQQGLVLLLGRCLPCIVPNVLLSKREDLVPLLLSVAFLHPSTCIRDELLHVFFNLFKRPDLKQRHSILAGCTAFGRLAGPSRLGSELLPQCWEQINHKYVERRLLVAEACGVLAPFLLKSIRSSLVLSMLQQMLAEQRVSEVREAVIRAVAIVLAYIDDPDKYFLVNLGPCIRGCGCRRPNYRGYELLLVSLADSAEGVQVAGRSSLLSSLACWAAELDRLESHLFAGLLCKLQALCSEWTTVRDERKLRMYLSVVHSLLPCLFVHVLQTAPFVQQAASVIGNVKLEEARFPKASSSFGDARVLAGGPERLAALVFLYEESMAAERTWASLGWIEKEMLPGLVAVAKAVGAIADTCVQDLCSLLHCLCSTFGYTFTDKMVKPAFQPVLKLLEGPSACEEYMVGNAGLPVYTSGVLASHTQDQEKLASFLEQLLEGISTVQLPLDVLKATFTCLSSDEHLHQLILKALWTAVVHPAPTVRCATAKVFEVILRVMNVSLVDKRVAPALVTLASDSHLSVRLASIPAFGAMIECTTQKELLERLKMQLGSMLDDAPADEGGQALQLEVVRTLGRVGPNAEPHFRDDFVIPCLQARWQTWRLLPEVSKLEAAMALFEAYSALACCFVDEAVLQQHFLPALRSLSDDMQSFSHEHQLILNSIIKDFELKLEEKNIRDSRSVGDSRSGFLGNVFQRRK
uniref:RAB11-binding protein RELCH homolog isoform X2 n=1 Tax=Myxine glutinosa TaxID=7769 RepID=UPI00358F7929